MKREDVKNKIPGITDEQLNWIMQENGADINREKSAATALQTQLENANAQLKTAQDGLKAFKGVDVAGLQEQVTKLKADMKAQAEGFAFDNALNAAIMSKKGRSVKAVRALLDLDALKGSAAAGHKQVARDPPAAAAAEKPKNRPQGQSKVRCRHALR